MATTARQLGMELRVSRPARRFIKRRCSGRIYVWPQNPDEQGPLGQRLEAAQAPPPGGSFWDQDVGGVKVFVRADVTPPGEVYNVLSLERRWRGGLAVGWTNLVSDGSTAAALLQSLMKGLFNP